MPTVETNKNCYNFSYLNRIACQYLLIVLLLWNYLLFKPQILMLVEILHSVKYLVFINGNQSVVLLMVWKNLILFTFAWDLCYNYITLWLKQRTQSGIFVLNCFKWIIILYICVTSRVSIFIQLYLWVRCWMHLCLK